MSALPPKADICSAPTHVRFGPKADIDGLRGPLIRNVLVFDRNYVAIQALLASCFQPFGWCADDYRASGKICWLPMLTANRLRKVLSYAPATGIFRWKVSASTRAPVGTIAGAKNGRGYRQIRIDGRPYSASRLAWLYMTGKWPNSEISYINGKPSDTRWANLREAPSSQNRSRPKRK
jgi:HNH endonuclease